MNEPKKWDWNETLISLYSIQKKENMLSAKLLTLNDKGVKMQQKTWDKNNDVLDQVDYLDIEYNKTALFKIPTKEYLERKLNWKIDDFDKRVRRFTYHKPIFQENDGRGKNIQRIILHSINQSLKTKQYAMGEFSDNNMLNGIGFAISENGHIWEGSFIDGKITHERKEVFNQWKYKKCWFKNRRLQGYYYWEYDKWVKEGYCKNGEFKGACKIKNS